MLSRPDARPPLPEASPAEVASLLAMVRAANVSLSDVLRHLVEQAAVFTPDVIGLVLAVRRPSGVVEVAATGTGGLAVDQLQRGLREGPVFDAVATGLPVGTGVLTSDGRWPRLASSARTLDVRSVLSVPVIADETVLGTLSGYASGLDAFMDPTGAAPALARLAGEVAGDIEAALDLERARALIVQERRCDPGQQPDGAGTSY